MRRLNPSGRHRVKDTGPSDRLDDTITRGAGAGITIVDGKALDRAFHVYTHPTDDVEIRILTIGNGTPAGRADQIGWVDRNGEVLEASAGTDVEVNHLATFTNTTGRVSPRRSS